MACANVLTLLHFDGADASTTITDSADSPHTYTAIGNAQIDTAQSVFGGASLLCDGTGDWVQSADSADWILGGGTGNFTIDFRVRFATVTACGFAAQRDNGNDNWVFEMVNTTTIGLRTTAGGAGGLALTWSWTPSTATWYHVALVRGWGGLGDNFQVAINGVGISVQSASHTFVDLAQTFTVCKDGTAGGTALNGWMDEFSLTNTARWTADFTPPTSAYCSAAGPTNLKTWDGLASASIKTLHGVTMADVKTWNGLT